jgi:tRNA (guanine37-N1)-methyltransferase
MGTGVSEEILKSNGLNAIHTHNIRDYTQDKHRRVDDYPYGGGCGMLMQAQPIYDCCAEIARQQKEELGEDTPTHVVFMTAAGGRYDQEKCKRLAQLPCLTLVCGHYEGIDQRVIDAIADEELSIGDYVITGGELAALVVADSVARLQPGVLAQPEGYEGESHYNGLLEYPQYTRPEVWQDRRVPEVLLSGHHAKIQVWQKEQSEARTKERRPDLWEKYTSGETD